MRMFVFPGQGSQVVGMGKPFYDNFNSAKEVFEKVGEAIGKNIKQIVFEGPEQDLTATDNAQVAIMTVSMCILEVMEKEFDFKTSEKVAFMAGHSLGEYSALTAAKSLLLEDTAKLLKIRGEAMLKASELNAGAMTAVIGIKTKEELQKLIDEKKEQSEVCVIANDNSPGQLVVSGNVKSIENIVANAKSYGARMAVKLAVSGAFHSPLMEEASNILKQALDSTTLNDPQVPIICNVTASENRDSQEIKNLLVKQVVSPVRWTETIQKAELLGVKEIVEIGQGEVLTGLTKRISPNIKRVSIQSIDGLENFVKDFL